MPVTQATVATANASRYLQQLCKHWAHKFPVEFTPEAGSIELPSGRTRLRAEPDALEIEIEAGEVGAVEQLQRVVAEHIERFAFRETLRFDWRPVSDR